MQYIILLKLICIEFFLSAFIFQVLVLFFKLIFIEAFLSGKSHDRAAWQSVVYGLERFRHDLATEHASVVALSIKWIINQNLSTSLNLSQFICIILINLVIFLFYHK